MAPIVQNQTIPAKTRASTQPSTQKVLAEHKANARTSKSRVRLKEQLVVVVVVDSEQEEQQAPVPPAKPKRGRPKKTSENCGNHAPLATLNTNRQTQTGHGSKRSQPKPSVASVVSDSPQPKKSHKKQTQCRNSKKNNNNNNNDDIDKELEQALLQTLSSTVNAPAKQRTNGQLLPETSYTHTDLLQFLANSSIAATFPFASSLKSNTQLLQRLTKAVYDLADVQLDQLLDLFHLAFMMQSYQELGTLCMGHRAALLQAVGELTAQLRPEHIEFIGLGLCDRFVLGTGNGRMQRVIGMQRALVLLIDDGDINHRIAMTALLATFAKISGSTMPQQSPDIISRAFELVRRVDWTQLIADGREADMFALVRTFGLIINSQHNRTAHANWDTELGSEIHKFFMLVLRTVRFSSHYSAFVMMVERFIAFCVVRGATASVISTDIFNNGSL